MSSTNTPGGVDGGRNEDISNDIKVAVAKRARDELHDAGSDDDFTPALPKGEKKKKANVTKSKRRKKTADGQLDETGKVFAAELLPFPYFYYRNHSLEMDEDPFTPVTQAGHVPCFPAKMHAILASPDLNDIVAWDDHGRSFRILKPKRFESDILPFFFEHSKFSSFIRQANGWGFRRFLSGPNRNSYYQEFFLRSMPWLCKKMRRPKVGEKKRISLEHEPDLTVIGRQFPVPNNPMTREIQIVLETIQQGPRARMPVRWVPPPAPEVPALAAVVDRNVAAMSSNGTMPSTNPYGAGVAGGAMTLHALQAQNNAADAPPGYLSPINNQTNQNAATGNSQNSGFLAGYRAAVQHYTNSMNGMLNFPLVTTSNGMLGNGMPGALGSHVQLLPMQVGGGIPSHTMPGSAALSAQINSQANAEYIQLMQMHMAAQGNGGMGAASVNHAPARNQNRSLTFEQLQAYQAGTYTPSLLPRQDGRS